MTNSNPPRRSLLSRLGIGTAIVGAIVAVVVSWTGIGDWRPFCGLTATCPAQPSSLPRELSPGSPVSVIWTGEGDRVKASWDAVDDASLDHYVVNIIALYPESFRIDAGYRIGQELETSREINPASDSMHWFEMRDEALSLTADQTWQVCVTGYRAIPEGAYIEEYEIAGSERCSDAFVLPHE